MAEHNEVGMIKKGVRTLISAHACPLDRWPLAVRHVGERRLRNQLNPADGLLESF